MFASIVSLSAVAGVVTAHPYDESSDDAPDASTPPEPPEIEAVRVDAGETLALAPVGSDTA